MRINNGRCHREIIYSFFFAYCNFERILTSGRTFSILHILLIFIDQIYNNIVKRRRSAIIIFTSL